MSSSFITHSEMTKHMAFDFRMMESIGSDEMMADSSETMQHNGRRHHGRMMGPQGMGSHEGMMGRMMNNNDNQGPML